MVSRDLAILAAGIATVPAVVSNTRPNTFCDVLHGVNLSSFTASGAKTMVIAARSDCSTSSQFEAISAAMQT
ncbi:hypothetical protein PF005_g24929 [Phytophthora fragariae]|uniref:Uncharacterized protein n=1 Tax=Phytophthora fragariae TaxID=53985 RepID=A0A6A4C1Y2_9STRA|nr:hypothetical protein PF003_g38777 [Phytophthora fragariae]KAE8924882.1 hypothetical protein PF009_g24894 [Phytophthora fragariae]KAE8979461.1 hypothetical protein PF011_g22839 [Phytophthora fragariae]KAE9077820.1 hypothetical protein PF007_g24103 [Phytophthora fragariae]KAE9094646.1 hypothetical protein PF006_g24173 [Phytophthora fragariae]